jgi:hypothetical protein
MTTVAASSFNAKRLFAVSCSRFGTSQPRQEVADIESNRDCAEYERRLDGFATLLLEESLLIFIHPGSVDINPSTLYYRIPPSMTAVSGGVSKV